MRTEFLIALISNAHCEKVSGLTKSEEWAKKLQGHFWEKQYYGNNPCHNTHKNMTMQGTGGKGKEERLIPLRKHTEDSIGEVAKETSFGRIHLGMKKDF